MATSMLSSESLPYGGQQRKSSRPPSNIFFTLARIILVASGLVPLVSGVFFTLLSTHSINILGAILPHEALDDPAFANLWRSLAVMWIAFCPITFLIVSDFVRYTPVFFVLALTVFCSGLVRFYTAYTYGIPASPMGYFVVYITTFVDLVFPVIAMLLVGLGLRKTRRQSEKLL